MVMLKPTREHNWLQRLLGRRPCMANHDIAGIVEDGRFRFTSRVQGSDEARVDFMAADCWRAA